MDAYQLFKQNSYTQEDKIGNHRAQQTGGQHTKSNFAICWE